MSVTPEKRAGWKKRLDRLTTAARRAQEDLLVAIHEATEEGVTQADIAYMIGDKSASSIKPKADKGEKIKKERTK